MPKRKNRIAVGLRYFWLNWLGRAARQRALAFLSRADTHRKTLQFNTHIRNFRRVLLILPENPCEVVLTQKCIIALKALRRNMEIDVIAESANRDLIKSNPYVDRGTFYGAGELLYNHSAFRQLTAAISGRAYDICFLFCRSDNPLFLVLAVQSGAPLRVGFAGPGVSPFINVSVRPSDASVYEGDRAESLIRPLGVKISKSRMQWNISKNAEKDVEGVLAQAGYRAGRPLAGVDLSPSRGHRPFPAGLARELFSGLSKAAGAELVPFYLAGNGRASAPEINGPGKDTVSISQNNVSFAAAFVHRCDLVICLNGLVYQLAVMLRRPVIGLFESAETRRWALREPGLLEIVEEKELKDIAAAAVAEKARAMLGRPPEVKPA
jgi:ADP-heptose:LPS heptosyltransferase